MDSNDTDITYHPIGVVESPHRRPEGMPIQPAGARGFRGSLRLRPEFAAALADLDGFSHVIVLYHFHQAGPFQPKVTPFLDRQPRGLFATRAPRRPNPIGLSVLRIVGIEGALIEVEDIDILDGTPVLDVKPYVPAFDAPADVRTGWMEQNAQRAESMRADDRFVPPGSGDGS